MVPRPELVQGDMSPPKDGNSEVAQIEPGSEEMRKGSTEDTEDATVEEQKG